MSTEKKDFENIPNEDKTDVNSSKTEITYEIPYRIKENIYNAYLLICFKKDLKIEGAIHQKQHAVLKSIMRFWAYFFVFVQYSAVFILAIVVIQNSTVQDYAWNYLPQNAYTLLIWPYFFIGTIFAQNEFCTAQADDFALRQISDDTKRSKRERRFFIIAEKALTYLGSILYFFVLAYYSDGTTPTGFLETILNLLAYAFILEVDDWAYPRFIEHFARTLGADQYKSLFEAYYYRKYKTDGGLGLMNANQILVSMIMLSIFSRSYVLLLLAIVIWVSFGFLNHYLNIRHGLYYNNFSRPKYKL